MKKLIYIMLSLCCLVFYSCGMTEPWKDWEHEGDMSADRLRPSEVKELLCAADGWKMIYQGVTFYFQFDEEGSWNRLFSGFPGGKSGVAYLAEWRNATIFERKLGDDICHYGVF